MDCIVGVNEGASSLATLLLCVGRLRYQSSDSNCSETAQHGCEPGTESAPPFGKCTTRPGTHITWAHEAASHWYCRHPAARGPLPPRHLPPCPAPARQRRGPARGDGDGVRRRAGPRSLLHRGSVASGRCGGGRTAQGRAGEALVGPRAVRRPCTRMPGQPGREHKRTALRQRRLIEVKAEAPVSQSLLLLPLPLPPAGTVPRARAGWVAGDAVGAAGRP